MKLFLMLNAPQVDVGGQIILRDCALLQLESYFRLMDKEKQLCEPCALFVRFRASRCSTR